MMPPLTIQELEAVKAFDSQAASFDQIYNEEPEIQYKRQRVRAHVEKFLREGAEILELNAGTGADAIYFSREVGSHNGHNEHNKFSHKGHEGRYKFSHEGHKGHRVHATDISPGMLGELEKKVRDAGLENRVTVENCSFNHLDLLKRRGPYDLVFSNFAGLNCARDLRAVLRSMVPLVKTGGMVTLVLLPRVCLWELLMVFRGRFRTAFRRFAGKKGAKAKINGNEFRCWYYNPSVVRKALPEFEMVALEGLCTLVPPTYLEGFSRKRPGLYGFLKRLEEKWRFGWPWRSIGDYYIITLRKQ